MTLSKQLICVLALVPFLALMGCGGGGGSGGSGAGNQAPFLGSVESVVTAGGPSILVRWKAATDDSDPASAIRYRVYLSATSGGHNFAAPAATSAPGATSMVLTSATSPLIAVGAEVFVVVRALDSAGLEGANRAECACTPVPAASVAYVNVAAAGPGTLGNPADPFMSIQDGINAVPAGGGVVLVAEGTISALSAALLPGTPGSTLGIYGGFPAASFTAGASPASLLGAHDPVGAATTINGVGVDPTTVVGQVGHLDIRNMGRRTYVGTLSLVDDEAEAMIGGVDVNIVVCGCRFNDVDPTMNAEPSEGCLFNESAPTASQRIALVGCRADNISDVLEATGGVEQWHLGGNCVEDCTQFIRGNSTAIPAGAAWQVWLDSNDLSRISSSGFDVYATAEVVGGAGSVDVRIATNRLVGINSDNEIDNFGEHGMGGTATILVEDNFVGPVDSSGIDITFIPFNNTDIETVVADTTVTFRRNTFVLHNSEVIDFGGASPNTGVTMNLLFEDLIFLQGDSEAIEWDRSFPGAATFNQDMASVIMEVRRNRLTACDGFVDANIGCYRAGTSRVMVNDNVCDGLTDEGAEVDMNSFSTGVTAQGTDQATNQFDMHRNTIFGTDESSLEIMDGRMDLLGPDDRAHFTHNFVFSGEESMDFSFSNEGVAMTRLDFLCENNNLRQADDDNILDVDFNDGAGGGTGVVYARICNNLMIAGRDIVEFDNFSSDGISGYLTFAHNSLSGSTEGESVDFSFQFGEWAVLLHRNKVIGGGDDSEEAFELGASDAALLDCLVRNNLCVGTGGGMEADDSINTVQFINNTVVFSGQGSNAVLGADNGFPNNAAHVHNCISHGNEGEDVGTPTVASYTLFEDPPGSAGFGSILGDPIFTRRGTILEPNTYFQLTTSSLGKDAGDPDSRFNDPDGTRNDMGAFGGPGAGTLGHLADLSAPCAPLLVGFDPFLHLHTGARLLSAAVNPVDVVFSHKMDPATVNAGSLPFTIGGVPVAGTYSTSGYRVTFTPSAAWPAGAQVSVGVTTVLKATNGLAVPFLDVRRFAIEGSATAETEANDTTGTANALPVAAVQSVTGALASDTDLDTFSLTGTAGQRLQVSCFGDRPADQAADFALRLIAPDGTTVVFELQSGVTNSDPLIDFTLPSSGTWFVQVFDPGSGAGAGPFPYELEIWQR